MTTEFKVVSLIRRYNTSMTKFKHLTKGIFVRLHIQDNIKSINLKVYPIGFE